MGESYAIILKKLKNQRTTCIDFATYADVMSNSKAVDSETHAVADKLSKKFEELLDLYDIIIETVDNKV
ncbi:MAG: hypothetical protein WC306_03845 [Candidatus Paceibacterota bacterium]|jgi:hypothetical protein